MGESKIKKAQTFQVSLTGKQRHVLYQIFTVGTPSQLLKMAGEKGDEKPSRKERNEHNRAWEALGLDDYEDMRPGLPENPNDPQEARQIDDAWQATVAATGRSVILTAENVRVIEDQINAAHKVQGLLNGRGLRRLGPVEELLDECRAGKHALPEALEVSANGKADEAEAKAGSTS